MTIKKQAKCCSLELAAICLFIFGVLFGLAWHEYGPEAYDDVRPGKEIISAIQMGSEKVEHHKNCGYHVNVDDEKAHVVWMLQQVE